MLKMWREDLDLSHLTRGAWIEILFHFRYLGCNIASHLTRGAWIEIQPGEEIIIHVKSHLTRGAWIEIWKNISDANVDSRTSHEVRGLK